MEKITKSVENNNTNNATNVLRVQRKITVGAVNDPLELEADAMADKIMRMPEANFIQRKCGHYEEEEKNKVQRKPLASFIQKKGPESGVTASDQVSKQINDTRGSGSALSHPTKRFMESRFGADFSDVKIHSNNQASEMAESLNAHAFTIGNDIYFNKGQYNPASREGRRLMAHELTHVMQQNSSVQKKKIQRIPGIGLASKSLCLTHTDEGVYEFFRDYYFLNQTNARNHIIHYRTGGGSNYTENVVNLFSANPNVRSRIALLINDQIKSGKTNSGSLIGRGIDDGKEPPIRQSDYDTEDWKNSNGNIDEVVWKLIGTLKAHDHNQFEISIRDPYTWHPLEDRRTQCIHQAMVNLKDSGAADYVTVGTGNVSLFLPPLAEPKTSLPDKDSSASFFPLQEKQNTNFFGPMIQAKLQIGSSADAYEQEADRIANQVMRMQDIGIQRKCDSCKEEKIQSKPIVQRKVSGSSKKTASPEITSRIAATRGSGRSLDKGVSAEMGSKMGADFSDVNIYTDSRAIQLSQDLGAKAFTVGNDIYFNKSQYNPSSGEGRRLIAHELVHTMQQDIGFKQVQRTCKDKVWKYEYDGCSLPPIVGRIIGARSIDNPVGRPDTAFSRVDFSLAEKMKQNQLSHFSKNLFTNEKNFNSINNFELDLKEKKVVGEFIGKMKGPCDHHDECYQTCHIVKQDAREECDIKMRDEMIQVCNDSSENTEIKNSCLHYASLYYQGLMAFGNITAFEKRQEQVCGCIGEDVEMKKEEFFLPLNYLLRMDDWPILGKVLRENPNIYIGATYFSGMKKDDESKPLLLQLREDSENFRKDQLADKGPYVGGKVIVLFGSGIVELYFNKEFNSEGNGMSVGSELKFKF